MQKKTQPKPQKNPTAKTTFLTLTPDKLLDFKLANSLLWQSFDGAIHRKKTIRKTPLWASGASNQEDDATQI